MTQALPDMEGPFTQFRGFSPSHIHFFLYKSLMTLHSLGTIPAQLYPSKVPMVPRRKYERNVE
jgi:hypothetical protein